MSYTCFDLTIQKGVAHLQFNRPDKFNTMNREFWTEFPDAVQRISNNAEARVIVISSTGKHFTAGMDLSVFQGNESSKKDSGADKVVAKKPHNGERTRLHVKDMQRTMSCLDEARMPVLVALQGGCIGGGVDLASSADCRYMTEDGYFCIQEVNIGITADVGTFPRLCKIMPEGMVKELAFTGRRMFADEALRTGLVNHIYPDHETMVVNVMQIAETIASKSPLVVTGSKTMINYARDHSIADGLDYIATWQAGMLNREEMAEVFAAKQEKREPEFADLAPLVEKLG